MGFEIRAGDVESLAIGDRGLTDDERRALDDDGYAVVASLLPPAQVDAMVAEFERLIAADPKPRSHELGNRRTKMTRDNQVLAVSWRHRVVLEAAVHLLGATFQVGHGDLRDPEPGQGWQQLHPDHGETPVPGLTATWFLDPFSIDNGATRIVPGSHRAPVTRPEIVPAGPAGSVLLREARLLHAAERNVAGTPRRSIHVFFQHDLP